MDESADKNVVVKALESAVVQNLGLGISPYTPAAERGFIPTG